MRLTNEVVLPAPPEQVFDLINDVERVAPCMPGATLQGRSGDDGYQGKVKVKVGPISAAYSGVVRFLEVDRAGSSIVLDARGADQHGGGAAEAKVRVQVRPHDDGSVLSLDTDLVIRGKVAQFGRGALGDVSQKLMEQFAGNLSGLLAEPAPAASPAEPASAPPTAAPAPEPQAAGAELDGMSLVALPLAKRIAPLAAALAVGVVAGRLLGGRGGRRGVLADEIVEATVRVGADRYTVPARRVVTLLGRR
ncbi:SRPBCC family protein [Saccharopolyspora erythraea]|uniref:SRPBCC family protein n=1 Tax=Saccharopolyspora erythraea TaxID=1836 RepID=UPI001BA9BE56|nr:SRPBCC family protein [Saccharopolyspora erythraea]QUH02587.1 SRPBCC family protein [Saccharopolyspora erythraea]